MYIESTSSSFVYTESYIVLYSRNKPTKKVTPRTAGALPTPGDAQGGETLLSPECLGCILTQVSPTAPESSSISLPFWECSRREELEVTVRTSA